MSRTRNLNLILADANGVRILGRQVAVAANGACDRSVAVAELTNNVEVALAIDASQLKLLVIQSDRDVTVKVNDPAAPDLVIEVKADKPLVWYEGCGLANPLDDTDVVVAYLNNYGAVAATVEIRVLIDATA